MTAGHDGRDQTMTPDTVTAPDIARFVLFDGLPDTALAALAAAATREQLPDGGQLFEQGTEALSLFALEAGRLALRSTVGGRTVIVQTIREGEVLGWSSLREGARWLTTARAIGEVRVVRLPVESVLDLLTSGSSWSRRLVRRMFGVAADHLDATRAQLQGLGNEGVITGG